MDKVLIFGSMGQLGSDLVDVLQKSGSFDVVPLTHEMADCTDADAVRRAVLRCRPHFVINSAAYVRVDDCEDHATKAFATNAIGALNIARASAEIGTCCVYISTDYVFDGKKKNSLRRIGSRQPNQRVRHLEARRRTSRAASCTALADRSNRKPVW